MQVDEVDGGIREYIRIRQVDAHFAGWFSFCRLIRIWQVDVCGNADWTDIIGHQILGQQQGQADHKGAAQRSGPRG